VSGFAQTTSAARSAKTDARLNAVGLPLKMPLSQTSPDATTRRLR
jgi:hypothetical protein